MLHWLNEKEPIFYAHLAEFRWVSLTILKRDLSSILGGDVHHTKHTTERGGT